MKKLNMNELKNVKGGTNWGQIGGACAGGAVWGLYFGNPSLGCANGVAGSLITQNIKSLKFPKKGTYEQMNNKLKDILLNIQCH